MNEHTAENGLRHEHCGEGACESCDCCAAGWCINFEDGDPWADSLGFFECITPRPTPGSPVWNDHRESFDLWCQIAVESRGFELRPRVTPPASTPGGAS